MTHRSDIFRILMAWTIVASSVVACQFSGAPSTSAVNTVVPGTGFVTVKPTLDLADSVQAFVPESGGDITLKINNGLSYELSIPDKALAYGQMITITPLQKLDGMPFSGGLIGGVDLKPDGLHLDLPATLTITLPGGYNLGGRKLAGFAYHGDGQNFHLSSATGDGQKITLTFYTFSGHGASSGTDGEMNQQNSRTSSDLQSDLDQLMTQSVPDDPSSYDSWKKQMDSVLAQMYSQLIALLKQAANDDSLIDAAESSYLQWMIDVGHYNFEKDEPYLTEIENANAWMKQALDYAFTQSADRCVSIPDLNELGNMYRYLHDLELLGLESSFTGAELNAFTNCANFNVTFTTTTTIKVSDTITVKVSVKGEGDLNAKISNELLYGGLNAKNFMALSGKGTIQTTDYEIDMKGDVCHASLDGADGTLWLAGMYDYRGGWVNDHMLDMVGFNWTGMNQKVQSITCGAGSDQVSAPALSTELPAWALAFSTVHTAAGEYHQELASLADGSQGALYFDLQPKSYNCPSALACVQKTYQGQQGKADITDEVDLNIMVHPKP